MSVDSAPNPLTESERTAYLALAKEMIAAVDEDTSNVAEFYT